MKAIKIKMKRNCGDSRNVQDMSELLDRFLHSREFLYRLE